jgi:hypothetical protein
MKQEQRYLGVEDPEPKPNQGAKPASDGPVTTLRLGTHTTPYRLLLPRTLAPESGFHLCYVVRSPRNATVHQCCPTRSPHINGAESCCVEVISTP